MAVVINGRVFHGNNLTMSGGKIIIDGVDVSASLPDAKEINIHVDGNIETLKVDACQKITVGGSVGSVQTMSGDVECGDVSDSVSTMSGDVDCGNIGGSVTTISGSVKHKKS